MACPFLPPSSPPPLKRLPRRRRRKLQQRQRTKLSRLRRRHSWRAQRLVPPPFPCDCRLERGTWDLAVSRQRSTPVGVLLRRCEVHTRGPQRAGHGGRPARARGTHGRSPHQEWWPRRSAVQRVLRAAPAAGPAVAITIPRLPGEQCKEGKRESTARSRCPEIERLGSAPHAASSGPCFWRGASCRGAKG